MRPELFLQKNLTRRAILKALGESALLGVAGSAFSGCAPAGGKLPAANKGEGLGALARSENRQYGVATQSYLLANSDFADALKREASMLVPESELKWYVLRPSPDTFDFHGYRQLASFAHANGMAMRGHTFVWYQGNPKWLEPALTSGRAAEDTLKTHIETVTKETAPMIRNWDVVNEAVDEKSQREDGLRDSIWLTALGPDYIPLAFNLAHAADPGLTLAYNDYGTEQEGGGYRRKRQCILRLLENCVRGKVPLHALGLQSHLQAHRPLAEQEFASFLKEVRALGLKIYITELDLDIGKLSGRTDDKIRIAQNYLRSYLDLVQQSGPVEMLLTWGLSDRYSWLRKENTDLRGILPLDDDYNRGPMWETLKESWLGLK